METSGFTNEQLDVREAVFKICSKYPDVCILALALVLRQLVDKAVGILGGA
jgi:hypothetical protein